jgi:hypothetical protein
MKAKDIANHLEHFLNNSDIGRTVTFEVSGYEACDSVLIDKCPDQVHDIVHMCRRPTGHKDPMHICDAPGCNKTWEYPDE